MTTFDSVAGDVRLALRTLMRERNFALTSLLTIALCLGANLALFAVVNAVLLRPLPFPGSERLVVVNNSYPKAGVPGDIGVSVPHYLERRAGIAAFADAAAYRDSGETIGDAGSPDRVDAMIVTPSFFNVLKVQPVLGRGFTEDEGTVAKSKVVILSDGLWRQKFGGDPNIIGRSIRLEGGTMSTVVGVMAPNFRFLSSHAQLWKPMAFSDDDRKPEQRHSNNMGMIARLKPGSTLAEAKAQVDALNENSLATDPYGKMVREAGFYSSVKDLHSFYTSQLRPVLLLLQAGVLFLLLIGAVNLTNLMLVRASSRAKDLSVRQVLGAGRARIASQLITEAVVLSLGGGVLGLGLAWGSLRGLNLLGADDLPRSGELSLDAVVYGVALLATLVLGFMLALPVVWQSFQSNLAGALSVESRGGTTSRAAHRLRHGLIVAQFSLAFVLLADAGLLGLSFSRVLAVNPGFRPENVLTGQVSLPSSTYKEKDLRMSFVSRLETNLHAVPGTAVGISTSLPFSGGTDVNAITVVGHEAKPGESLQAHYSSAVTGDYFGAMGIALREGRFLNSDDTARKQNVCVVDEVFAKYYWPNGGAIGHEVMNGVPSNKEPHFTIVGVVGAVKQNDLADEKPRGAIYFPYFYQPARGFFVVVRTMQSPEAASPVLRAAALKLDPNVPVSDMKTLTGRVDESLVGRRSPMMLAAIFAGVALVLAAVGLYGVLAYAVAQRRREIGVRMALGARPDQIRGQFLRLGAQLVAAGVAIGLLGAWLSSRAMASLLFGVGAVNLGVLIATAAVLVAVALVACLLPAARAAKVPPMEALRG